MRASIDASAEPALAGGPAGADRVRALTEVAMTALAQTAAARPGPIPSGGPAAVAAALATVLVPAPGNAAANGDGGSAAAALPAGRAAVGVLPERGAGEQAALRDLTAVLAAGSVDPTDPWCAAHLHGPTLAVAADLVGGVPGAPVRGRVAVRAERRAAHPRRRRTGPGAGRVALVADTEQGVRPGGVPAARPDGVHHFGLEDAT